MSRTYDACNGNTVRYCALWYSVTVHGIVLEPFFLLLPFIIMSPVRKTVLVAEDEALIRFLAVEALADAGFHIIEVAHTDEALAVLKVGADEIDLLFTDINMPGSMNGLELAHHVHSLWPRVALLIASGNARPTRTELPPGRRFLTKPYAMDEVVEHVATLVSG